LSPESLPRAERNNEKNAGRYPFCPILILDRARTAGKIPRFVKDRPEIILFFGRCRQAVQFSEQSIQIPVMTHVFLPPFIGFV
jgi:hypothetical protein